MWLQALQFVDAHPPVLAFALGFGFIPVGAVLYVVHKLVVLILGRSRVAAVALPLLGAIVITWLGGFAVAISVLFWDVSGLKLLLIMAGLFVIALLACSVHRQAVADGWHFVRAQMAEDAAAKKAKTKAKLGR